MDDTPLDLPFAPWVRLALHLVPLANWVTLCVLGFVLARELSRLRGELRRQRGDDQ